ncbi:MAG TPA: glycosyltransferase [Steroidobacteraceae bacterium]|jgi:glycosyltransferase involved in cell wall biosynthesis|nr:glycosyltransferase [Steroidobacteraceae bacterium]
MISPAYAEASLVHTPVATGAQAAEVTRPDALFVLNNLGYGGSERKIVRLANRLTEEGLRVSMVCLNGPYDIEQGLRRDVTCTRLERRGKLSLAALWRLRQLLVGERPATVLSVNLYPSLFVALATLLLPRRPRTVALINTSTYRGSGLMKRVYQWVLARFDLTVHGSIAQRDFWLKTHGGDSGNSAVIYNGVDSDHFEVTDSLEAGKRLRASLGVKPESLLFGTVGMCRPEKNQEVLLSTLRRLRVARVDAHLVIAGAGPLLDHLKRRACELEIADRVHFVGAIEDVRPVLAAIDLFVLPSTAVESFSNAALEAMSMGRPVILSDIGGAREMISDGIEGYVVSPTELPARLPAIIAALYADRRKRLQMGAAARQRAVTCFSVPAMVAGYRGLLHDGASQ